MKRTGVIMCLIGGIVHVPRADLQVEATFKTKAAAVRFDDRLTSSALVTPNLPNEDGNDYAPKMLEIPISIT